MSEPEKKADLEPCPCGCSPEDSPKVEQVATYSCRVVSSCGYRGPWGTSREQAVRLWNRRPRLEAMRAIADYWKRRAEASVAQEGRTASRLRELEAWKASAMTVLGDWDLVANELPRGRLGHSVTLEAVASIQEMKADLAERCAQVEGLQQLQDEIAVALGSGYTGANMIPEYVRYLRSRVSFLENAQREAQEGATGRLISRVHDLERILSSIDYPLSDDAGNDEARDWLNAQIDAAFERGRQERESSEAAERIAGCSLFLVQDDDRPMYVLALDWTKALEAWRLLIEDENPPGPGESAEPAEPDGIQRIAEPREILIGVGARP